MKIIGIILLLSIGLLNVRAGDAASNAVAGKSPPPVTSVFDSYCRIQAALAQDSFQNAAREAQALAKSVNDDATATFPKKVAQQAEAVARAADLRGARVAFKPLSQSFIAFAALHPALAGAYRQVHCPMADADWLQKESTVNNPYLGGEMLHCGEFVKSNDNGKK